MTDQPLPPPPPALMHAMRRYVVAAHLAHLALVSNPCAPPEFVLSLMLSHHAASVEFFMAAAELSTPQEAAALDRFTVLVDRDLGLRPPAPAAP